VVEHVTGSDHCGGGSDRQARPLSFGDSSDYHATIPATVLKY
jgi:hypothetical protein